MEGNALVFAADRLHRERTAGLEREHAIRRSIADRGMTITPLSPAGHTIAGVGVWFRSLFMRQRPLRFS
jgi:hypothetical protein